MEKEKSSFDEAISTASSAAHMAKGLLQTGKALSGAAKGAAAGGPYGAVIGAALGARKHIYRYCTHASHPVYCDASFPHFWRPYRRVYH